LLGAFLVALVYTILIVAEANEYWHNVFVGALILAAVVLDVLVQRLRRAQA
jgi:ribose/xylose/arabinose/galactoside ABC-type transport system permease subunit